MPSGVGPSILPRIDRTNKPSTKPKTPSRLNKPMPIENLDEMNKNKLRRAGSLSDIPSTARDNESANF